MCQPSKAVLKEPDWDIPEVKDDGSAHEKKGRKKLTISSIVKIIKGTRLKHMSLKKAGEKKCTHIQGML